MTPDGVSGLMARLILPARARDAVLGDLEEEFGASGAAAPCRRVATLLGIALHYQAAPYRDRDARLAALTLFGAGVALLWAVHRAAWPEAFPPQGYDPLSTLALRFWAAPHLVAAVAVGLFAGRCDALPDAAGPCRVHVVAAQAGVVALLAPGGAGGALTAGLLLLAAASLGAAARADATRAVTPARRPRASNG